MSDPAGTGPCGSAILEMPMFAARTSTEAVDWSVPSLVVVTVAMLVIVPASFLVVWEVTWIGPLLPPEASVAKVQSRVWDPTAPFTAQPEKAGLRDQLRSAPAGSGSETTTLWAVPRPLF